MSADVRRAKLRAVAAYMGAVAALPLREIENRTVRQVSQDATDYAERRWIDYMGDDDGTE